jgi:glucose-6-phosphate dehydrogenase assembly protein OpcA
MAATLTITASSARTVESDLAAVWRELAAAAPFARALMSNLVVICDATDRLSPEALLESPLVTDVARRHPPRVIALQYIPDASRACSPSDVTVGVLTFADPVTAASGGSRYGVEMIGVRAACTEASLPSIVRALTRGEVPTTIWWIDDLSRARRATAVLTAGEQLLYDSRSWQRAPEGFSLLAELLDDARCPILADVNWRRLAPLRQSLARSHPSSFRVRPASRGATAWLLAGWLRTRGVPVDFTDDGVDVESAVGHGSENDAAAVAAELRRRRRDDELRDSVKAAAALAAR